MGHSDNLRRDIWDPSPRFAEWSSACVNMQLKALNDDSRAPSVHYMGIFLQDDVGMMDKHISNVTGTFMAKWYDRSEMAGPSRRPCSNFSEAIPSLEILVATDNQLKILSMY